MDIIICGAGEVGSHTATELATARNNITLIDSDPEQLRRVEEGLDVRTLVGDGADAAILCEAGAAEADLIVAATNSDEINLLTASIGKGLGARKSIARIHHHAFLEDEKFNYQKHFNIDRLICPEFSTAQAIARKLRNPGAVVIENFARGRIEMQQFTASEGGSAIGKRLSDVHLPPGTRLALIRRKDEAFIPEAQSVVVAGDSIILVGNTGAFADARKLFHADKPHRQRVVIMGGTSMAVWLCRFLRDRNFSIRLFETDRERAEELAEKLNWVTVIQANPTDRTVFDEEHLVQADAFLSVLDDDEDNIIAAVLVKMRGVSKVFTVVQKSQYLDLIYDIGVDMAFSPRIVAAEEIDAELDESTLRHLGTLAEGIVDVFRVRITDNSPVIGKSLREIQLSPDWVVAAIQREREAHVPGADDVIESGDIVLVVGRKGKDETLRKILAAKK